MYTGETRLSMMEQLDDLHEKMNKAHESRKCSDKNLYNSQSNVNGLIMP